MENGANAPAPPSIYDLERQVLPLRPNPNEASTRQSEFDEIVGCVMTQFGYDRKTLWPKAEFPDRGPCAADISVLLERHDALHLQRQLACGVELLAHDRAPPPSLPSDAVAASEYADVQAAYDFWNEFAKKHGLPQAAKLTEQRRKAIKARIEDADGLDKFKKAIESISTSPFLLGDKGNGQRANLDWLLKETFFIRLLEGNYHDANRPWEAGHVGI